MVEPDSFAMSQQPTASQRSAAPTTSLPPRQISMRVRRTVQELFPPYITPLGPWRIEGKVSQMMHVELAPEANIICTAGAMRYVSPGVEPFAKRGNFAACCCGKEDYYRVVYTNEGGLPGALLGIAPPFNANIVPISLDIYPGLVIRGGAFLAAMDVNINIRTKVVRDCSAFCAAGGPFLHYLEGKDIVFLNAGGTLLIRTLRPGESLVCSSGSVVAFQSSCIFTVEPAGDDLITKCCGGQGLFNTRVEGPGLVIMQSLSFSEFRNGVNGSRS